VLKNKNNLNIIISKLFWKIKIIDKFFNPSKDKVVLNFIMVISTVFNPLNSERNIALDI